MTVHLDRYDGELWCGHHRTAGGHTADYRTIIEDGWGNVDFAPIAEVDCEACLEAAHAFGDRCWARRVELARAAVAERDAISPTRSGTR